MSRQKISLEVSPNDEGVAYLYLPDHPGQGSRGAVDHQTQLCELIENYKGPDIYLDFDIRGRLIGIEIIS